MGRWSPSSGACGTFPAALAGYALQDPEDYRSPRPKADKRLGSCWGSRSCLSGWSWSTGGQGTPRGFSKAQVLLAARPGMEMPRSGPAIFHLGYTRHKMWQSLTPPSLVGNGLLPPLPSTRGSSHCTLGAALDPRPTPTPQSLAFLDWLLCIGSVVKQQSCQLLSKWTSNSGSPLTEPLGDIFEKEPSAIHSQWPWNRHFITEMRQPIAPYLTGA